MRFCFGSWESSARVISYLNRSFMLKIWTRSKTVTFAIGLSCMQGASIPAQTLKTDSQPVLVKVYTPGDGVIAPELLPIDFHPSVSDDCKSKSVDTVDFSLIVDAEGLPRNLALLDPRGTDQDELAFRVASLDRFQPGTLGGVPVAVAQTLEVEMPLCIEHTKNAEGAKVIELRLKSQPVQKFHELPDSPKMMILIPVPGEPIDPKTTATLYRIGGKVTPPYPLSEAAAQFSEMAKKKGTSGVCVVSLVVDTQGRPENIHILKSLDPELDQNAIKAVRQYRFKPAMLNKQPVPVSVVVEVNFRLY